MTVVRVWFNKTFSSVYNVARLLGAAEEPSRFHVLCSHTNGEFVGLQAGDESFLEPVEIDRDSYVSLCLELCVRHGVDVFVPGRALYEIACRRDEFEAMGVRLLVAAAPEYLVLFEDKRRFYEELATDTAIPPRCICVNTVAEFSAAVDTLRSEGSQVCFKPSRSTGGLGFRILDDRRSDVQNLLSGESVRLTRHLAETVLRQVGTFRDLLVMEYLPGAEYSVDCIAEQGRLFRAVARRKPTRTGGAQFLEKNDELVALAERLTEAYGLSGIFNVQVRYNGSMPKVLEINARMAGGIYFSCLSGLNFPAWGVGLAAGVADVRRMPEPRFGLHVHQQNHEFVFRSPPMAKAVE